MITLSKDQDEALKKIIHWYKNFDADVQPYFYLAGYAGTGKTTLLDSIRRELPKSNRCLHAAFTGKAALQMNKKGAVNASTIHSLIYIVDEETEKDKDSSNPQFKLNEESPLRNADLLIIDEVSMVNKTIGQDLLHFKKPILVLGDPGQLPPIEGAGFFTSKEPDAMLTNVHRQALDNPIIRIATAVRSGKALAYIEEGDVAVYPRSRPDMMQIVHYDQILTGMNKTRVAINEGVRSFLGHRSTYPCKDEKIICTRNCYELGLFNGLSCVTLEDTEIDPGADSLIVSINADNGRDYEDLEVHQESFNDPTVLNDLPYYIRKLKQEFTWGYAITVHKAQGSEWDNVCIVDDGFLGWKRADRIKWLYTAITRAANKLTIIRSK